MTKENNQIKRSNKGMRPLAYALKPLTEKAFGKKSSIYGQLVTQWHSITAGMDCAQTTPVKLKFPRGKNNGATVTLATSSSQAFTLQHSTPQIIQRINQFFGYRAVEKINFIHQPMTMTNDLKIKKNKTLKPDEVKEIEDSLNFVSDEGIKESLVAIAKSVIHRG